MAVFYNSRSGYYAVASQSLNPAAEALFLSYEAQLHSGTGWHEYSTLADMQAAVKANSWPAPTRSLTGAAGQGAATEGGAALGGGYHLVFGNTTGLLGRILKVVLGAVLLLSGIIRMTSIDKAALGAAGKAAVLA